MGCKEKLENIQVSVVLLSEAWPKSHRTPVGCWKMSDHWCFSGDDLTALTETWRKPQLSQQLFDFPSVQVFSGSSASKMMLG